MTIIISPAASASPRIGYKNLFESASTVTASSEATGYEGSNVYNWDTSSYWKPAATGTHYLTATFSSAVTVDYFAIYAHNLHTYNASVQLQYSTDGTTWNDATDPQAPSTSRPVFVSFTSILAAWLRIKLVTTSGPAQIGVASFGEAMIFPSGMKPGFQPPTLSREGKYMNSVSEGGQFLGRSLLRNGAKTKIDLILLDPLWVRENWEPFIRHAEAMPFFFSWDYENHPNEAAFCFTSGKIPPAKYSDPQFMSVSLPVDALIE
jgi:hypothetical protein